MLALAQSKVPEFWRDEWQYRKPTLTLTVGRTVSHYNITVASLSMTLASRMPGTVGEPLNMVERASI